MIKRILLVSILALATVLGACSDDDPVAPPGPRDDGVIHIPDEVATLAEAVAVAAPGDSLVITTAEMVGDVTVDKALIIVGAAPSPQITRLVTDEGPLVLAADDGDIRLEGLRISGGEMAVSIDVGYLDTVDLIACDIADATTGVAIEGDGGRVGLQACSVRDCGQNGVGVGVRVWGTVDVTVSNGFIGNTGGGGGVAATVSDRSDLKLRDVEVTDHDAGNRAVLAATGESLLMLERVTIRDCVGTAVFSAGGAQGFSEVSFEACQGTLMRIETGLAYQQIDELHVRDCEGLVVSVTADQVVQLWYSSIAGHTGDLVDVAAGAEFQFNHVTVHDVAGRAVVADEAATVQVHGTILANTALPAIDGGTIAIEQTDCWQGDGIPAWEGLEAFLGVDGNIEADPLFCDAAAGQFTLQPESPCVGDTSVLMGAFEAGCD